MKKIAFLFLTLKDINFPKIWDQYLNGHDGKYSIYIHPKYTNEIIWHPERIIKNLKETGWGHITRAYIELFKAAISDKDNYKFITISETCVPIQSFDKLYEQLTKDNMSWIKLMKITKYKYEVVLNKSKGHFIHHYARMCLNRHHVKKLLVNKDKMEFFHQMHIGDEYFLSVLYPLTNYIDREITYDDWAHTEQIVSQLKNRIKQLFEEQDSNSLIDNTNQINKLREEIKHIAGHPKSIIDVKEDLNNIKNCKAFFYRKFKSDSNIEQYWKEIIEYHNKFN
jgi:hypothetical protein